MKRRIVLNRAQSEVAGSQTNASSYRQRRIKILRLSLDACSWERSSTGGDLKSSNQGRRRRRDLREISGTTTQKHIFARQHLHAWRSIPLAARIARA